MPNRFQRPAFRPFCFLHLLVMQSLRLRFRLFRFYVAQEFIGQESGQPLAVVPSVEDNPWAPSTLAFSLGDCVTEIKFLDPLALDVEWQVADHVGRVWGAGKLLAAPGLPASDTKERSQFAFAHFAFLI